MTSGSGAGIATLMVSCDSELDEDVAALLVDSRLRHAGHRVVAHAHIDDSEQRIRSQLLMWISDPEVHAVVMTAGWNSTVALAPLVTERFATHVRCGQALVFVLPPSAAEMADVLERVVLPELARARVAPSSRAEQRLSTDKIAVIGDLPSAADSIALVDLREGRKRHLWTMAAVVAAVGGAFAGTVFKRNQVRAATQPVEEIEEPIAMIAPEEPAPAPPPAPAVAPAPRVEETRRPVRVSKRTSKAPAQPAQEVVPPPELEAAPAIDDGLCTQETCALHDNERECCAPFRVHPHRLDRAMIARAIGVVKPRALDCRATQGDGLVKVWLDVGSDGRVTKVAVVESPEANVGQCVANALREAEFPPTDEGGSFSYSIDLGR